MFAVYVLMGLLMGIMFPVQAGINARLRLHLNDPVLASLVSFFVGTVALALYAMVQRAGVPSVAEVGKAPWWAWIGGTLGAYVVASSVVLAPKLGATSMLALAVAGQMAASLVLDQYGWLGFRPDPMTVRKVVGAVLLVVGVVLVVKR